MTATQHQARTDLAGQARRAYRAVETGDLRDVEEYVAPTWRNREAAVEPPAARGHGPAAFAATVSWLRTGLTELSFVEHQPWSRARWSSRTPR